MVQPVLAGLHILIVENEATVALHLSEGLRRAGARTVEIKASAWQARQRLEQPPTPDIAILDYDITGQETGVDVALWMRQQPALQRTRRILYTGSDIELLSRQFPDNHLFHLILSKPLSIITLIEQIAALNQPPA